jgi:UDP-N-acetylmuramoyl-tripeptide--D-alanyl-D-alanine ligase (EC 6.3.2.10)
MIPVENDISGIAGIEIHGVTINSNAVEPGNLFVPLKGERHDGHEFVAQAYEHGAAASLWKKDMPDPPAHLPLILVEDPLKALQDLAKAYRKELSGLQVVAVTGSNGKTTTKDMIATILSTRYRVKKTMGNFNNHIGMPLTILRFEQDTEVAVLEMGMNHPGEISFLSRLAEPDVAVITNIGEAHLSGLGSREGIAKAKMEILEGLKDGGLLVIPGDEPLIEKELAKREKRWEIRTFGHAGKNNFRPAQVHMENGWTTFTVKGMKEIFRLPVLGEHNVENALAAMLVGVHFHLTESEMREAFKNLELSKMRMECQDGINGAKVINDAYNASPTSMKAALKTLSELKGYTKKIAVLGDMLELGEKEVDFHRDVGRTIDPGKVEYVFTFGKLGRVIAEGCQERFAPEKVFTFTDKEELVSRLIPLMDKDTVVLVKASRGMKMEEIVEKITMK